MPSPRQASPTDVEQIIEAVMQALARNHTPAMLLLAADDLNFARVAFSPLCEGEAPSRPGSVKTGKILFNA
jgi:hypothetical protein